MFGRLRCLQSDPPGCQSAARSARIRDHSLEAEGQGLDVLGQAHGLGHRQVARQPELDGKGLAEPEGMLDRPGRPGLAKHSTHEPN